MARRLKRAVRAVRQVRRGGRRYAKFLKTNRKKIQRVKRVVRKGARYTQKGLSTGAKLAAASGHPEVAAGLLLARSGVRSLRRLDKKSQRLRKRVPRRYRQYIP